MSVPSRLLQSDLSAGRLSAQGVIARCLPVFFLPVLFATVGCQSSDPGPSRKVVETVTVRDSQGNEKQIPFSDLSRSDESDFVPVEILVIDRQTREKLFLALDQIPAATQVTARYLPVTVSQSVPLQTGEEQQSQSR